MGIDAEMFVRLRRNPQVTHEEVLDAAYWLASTLGHDNFIVSKEHHALELLQPQTAEADWRDAAYDGKVCWYQDGETLTAEEGEQFIRVHIFTRYYGKGYERGNWMLLRTTIEWLKRRWPDCSVWYGGDSSGICAEEMTEETLAELDELFFSKGREAYTHYSSWGASGIQCKICEHEMANTGGGGGDSYFYCHGCGQYVVETSQGIFGPAKHGESIFKLHDRVRQGQAEIAPDAVRKG